MANPILPGRKAVAQIEGRVEEKVREDNNRVRRQREIRGEVQLAFNPGDEKARVGNTRSFKSWFSNRDGGLTVESSVSVSVVCNQDQHSMEIAINEAGMLAEAMAKKGAEEMGVYIDNFAKDVSG